MRFAEYPDVRERQLARSKPLGQRRAIDELHRKIGAPKIRIDGKYEIAHDRFMLEIVQRRGLAPEQSERVRDCCESSGQDHLDRDGVSVWMLKPL